MTDEPYSVLELTIQNIVEGMRDAMDHHSGALRKLALSVGSNALECLLRDYTILSRQHSQMTKIIADLPDGNGLQLDDAG